MAADACDGCLGTHTCWICHGDGCTRCAGTGLCHLCHPDRVVRLVPPTEQVAPDAAPAPKAP